MSNSRSRELERLAVLFKALSNPQRLRMFVKLAAARCAPDARRARREGASFCCAGDLGTDLKLAASTVSHHLKELRQAGLMQVERRGQRIDCRVSEEPLRLLASFFERCGSCQDPSPGAGKAAPASPRRLIPEGGAR